MASFSVSKVSVRLGPGVSIVLPRDPAARPGQQAQSFLVTAVWAPTSTDANRDEIDVFWDGVSAAG